VVRGDSTDDRWNVPMELGAGLGQEDTVEVVALVIGSYRPRRR
jgi:hypothetical protein